MQCRKFPPSSRHILPLLQHPHQKLPITAILPRHLPNPLNHIPPKLPRIRHLHPAAMLAVPVHPDAAADKQVVLGVIRRHDAVDCVLEQLGVAEGLVDDAGEEVREGFALGWIVMLAGKCK